MTALSNEVTAANEFSEMQKLFNEVSEIPKEELVKKLVASYMCEQTGTYSRAYYEARLKKRDNEFQKIFLDANYLKEINDKWGHKAGDEYLCSIINVVNRFKSPQDTLVRWTRGDEFILFVAKPRSALEIKLEMDIEFTKEGLSVAAGVGDTIDEADKSMYRDKEIKKIRDKELELLKKTNYKPIIADMTSNQDKHIYTFNIHTLVNRYKSIKEETDNMNTFSKRISIS
ncbi:hypothetical protein CN918_25180 [Priestia megaterium]|nr:hypothetical protein CN918_25180 [Priestia megaterium]